jgi:hypothetical protein
MRGLRQCGSDDIFNAPPSCCGVTEDSAYSKNKLFFFPPPDSDYSDPSLLDSDSEEDLFEFNTVPARPFCELESRGDPRDASVYVDIIAQILRDEEPNHLIKHGSVELLQGSKIKDWRFLLGEWMFSLSFVYPSTTEALFQAISLLDRYLARRSAAFSKLQLMACCCLWVAAKVELHTQESLEPLFVHCHDKFTRADFIRAEAEILSAVDYEIHSVTPYFFLKRFLSVADVDERVTLLASYICESTLLFLELSSFRPSVIAFCAVASACLALDVGETFHNLAGFLTCLDRDDTVRCFRLVLRAGQSLAAREKHCPFRKYAARPLGGVAGAGIELIRSVDLGDDLVRRFTTLLGGT